MEVGVKAHNTSFDNHIIKTLQNESQKLLRNILGITKPELATPICHVYQHQRKQAIPLPGPNLIKNGFRVENSYPSKFNTKWTIHVTSFFR